MLTESFKEEFFNICIDACKRLGVDPPESHREGLMDILSNDKVKHDITRLLIAIEPFYKHAQEHHNADKKKEKQKTFSSKAKRWIKNFFALHKQPQKTGDGVFKRLKKIEVDSKHRKKTFDSEITLSPDDEKFLHDIQFPKGDKDND